MDIEKISDEMCRVSNPGIWRAFQNSTHLIQGEEGYKQAFLKGHQSTITYLEISASGRLMASVESGKTASLILWDMLHGRKITSLRPHADSIRTVAFSADGSLMVTVGTDAQHRVQIIVWDVKLLSAQSPEDAIIAKQLSDFSINRIAFLPFDDLVLQNLNSPLLNKTTPATTATTATAAAAASEPGLVSCGRENIRFWRIRKGIRCYFINIAHKMYVCLLALKLFHPHCNR